MSIVIQEMTTQDYDEVLTLWRSSEGVGLSDADLEEGVAHFLDRNPGLSFVARDGEHLVGAVLCGHDGRRGYIHHRSAEPLRPAQDGAHDEAWLSASLIAAEDWAEHLLGDACPPSGEPELASAISSSSPTIRTSSPSGRTSDGQSGLNW